MFEQQPCQRHLYSTCYNVACALALFGFEVAGCGDVFWKPSQVAVTHTVLSQLSALKGPAQKRCDGRCRNAMSDFFFSEVNSHGTGSFHRLCLLRVRKYRSLRIGFGWKQLHQCYNYFRMINWCRASLLHQPFTMILANLQPRESSHESLLLHSAVFLQAASLCFSWDPALVLAQGGKGAKGAKGPKRKSIHCSIVQHCFTLILRFIKVQPSLEVKSKCAAMFLVAMENCQMFFDSGTANTWETLLQDYFWSAMTRPRSAPA